MAFLLPLAEFAGGVAELGTFVTGSEAAGSALGGAAAGYVGTKANEKASSLGQQALDAVVSKEQQERFSRSAHYIASKFLVDSGDPDAMLPKKPLPNLGPNKNGPNGITPGPIAKNAADIIKNGQNNCSCPDTGADAKRVDNITGPSYSLTPTIIGSSVDIVDDKMATGQSQIPTIIKLKPITKKDNGGFGGEGSPIIDYTVKDPGEKEGEYLGRFIGNSILSSNDEYTMVSALLKNPETSPIAKQYLDFFQASKEPNGPAITIYNDPRYPQISGVYNGKVIRPNITYITPEGYFAAMDEVGMTEIYRGPQAPKGLGAIGLLAAGFLPPIYGIYTGPKSPNNELPLRDSLLDQFSFFHDTDYSRGWFDAVGDMKYVSRLTQNMDRFNFTERLVANFAVKWFSTASYILGKVTGSLQEESPAEGNFGDLYSYIIRTNQKNDSPKIANYVEFGPEYLMQPIRVDPKKRREFYNGMLTEMNKIYINNAPCSTDPTHNNYGSGLSILDSIIVEDIYD